MSWQVGSVVAGALLLAGMAAMPAGGVQQQSQAGVLSTPQAPAQQSAGPQQVVEGKPGAAEKPRVLYKPHEMTAFHTSDRCVACHNTLFTREGEDVSIGSEWRASIMANSSRDPYWQGSVRRETIDHPAASEHIQDECSNCHMATVHLADRDAGRPTTVFDKLPLKEFPSSHEAWNAAADGVTCTVCHQVKPDGLGTDATFNGNVVIAKAVKADLRPEYGPYDIDYGHQATMHSSTGGYLPMRGDHMRDAGLCGSCHTLYTDALGPNGEKLHDRFPEQVPYQEWQHSDFATKQTCQQCHMPEIKEPVKIAALFGQLREGVHRHVFVGPNFVMEGMLRDHRDELKVAATEGELDAAMARSAALLQTQSGKVSIERVEATGSGLAIEVLAQNLTGHKLPTAYPARRAWLHVVVRDAAGKVVFESGAVRPDGSIVGNDNDDDPTKFEPHYSEITRPDQVEIYEDILLDAKGRVTTGLLSAVRYGKDNRLLPAGFNKETADKDIQVVGEARNDPNFTDKGSRVRYVVDTHGATGPLKVQAELWYEPIGFRWAHNLEPYKAAEPQRMVRYYDTTQRERAMLVARAEVTR